ncbi:hypothetical protein J1N35_008199, partial [Gossypium stocksii]
RIDRVGSVTFGDDLKPQFGNSRLSLYHSELHRQAPTPNIEDIGLASSVLQYPFTPNDEVYDYITFLSTPKANSSNYQTPPQ